MDHVEDKEEPDPWWAELGAGPVVNVATGLYFSACLALSQLDEQLRRSKNRQRDPQQSFRSFPGNVQRSTPGFDPCQTYITTILGNRPGQVGSFFHLSLLGWGAAGHYRTPKSWTGSASLVNISGCWSRFWMIWRNLEIWKNACVGAIWAACPMLCQSSMFVKSALRRSKTSSMTYW